MFSRFLSAIFILLLARPVLPQALPDFFVGQPAPDFKLKDLDGHELQLSSLKGHIVLLDFWASWCAPCRMELPGLERIAKKYQDKDVTVLGVNSQEPQDVVRKFVAASKLTYPIVLTVDSPSVIRDYKAWSLPTVVMVDKTGVIAAYHVGANPGSEDIFRKDISRLTDAKYVSPRPKFAQLESAQMPQAPAAPRNASSASAANGPDPNWQPNTPDEFLARGYARLRVRKYPLARVDAEEALKLNPDLYVAHFLHGQASYDDKDYATAIQDFDQVIKQQPDWPDAYRYRGLSYSYSGQHERALPDYRKAIELDPNRASNYNALGWACTELGRLEDAKANLDKAVELEPDFILARENRAKLFAKLGDSKAEVSELSMIVHIRPGNQWASDTRDAVLQGHSPYTATVQPRVLSKTEPSYTEEARKAGVSTSVLLAFVVSASGMPENIHVVRGAGFGLDERAVQSLGTWRFEPGEKNGVAAPTETHVEMNFRLLVPKHDQQVTRLNFTLPPGAARPELVHGQIPANPGNGGPAKMRIALSVGMDGRPANLSLLETTSPEWANKAIEEIRDWRFRPTTLNGAAVEVQGIFELELAATGAVTFNNN